MKSFLTLGLLGAVLVLAAVLREAPAAGHELPAEQRVVRGLDGSGAEVVTVLPRWLVDDPDAAYHLRRVELTLGSGSVALRDRFLNHPHGSAIPWPPLLDGVLALLARVALSTEAGPTGEAALGGRSEAALEGLLVHTPTVLGVLTCLALFLVTRSMCRGSRASADPAGTTFAPELVGLVAATIYAALPIAIWYGGVTRVDHHVLIALFMALHVGLLSWTLRATELTDATLGALLAGVLGGLALSTWLASAVFVGLGGAVLILRALSSDADEARNGARAGVLYFLSAAVVTLVPAAESPWNQELPGSLINMTEGVPRALLAGCAPFVAILLVARTKQGALRPPALRAAAGAVALVAVVLLLPGFLAGAGEGFSWASRHNGFMAIVEESQPLLSPPGGRPWWTTAVGDLTPLAFLFPLAWLALVPSFRRPERLLVLASGAAMLWMTLTQRRFGNSLAVPFALTFGLALHDRLAERGARGTRPLVVGSALLVAVSLVFGTSPLRTSTAELLDLRAWRAEKLAGLRWMRAGTPTPGAWNAPEARQDYGVLASWGDGHLIEYHARRPTITTNFGSFVGEDGFRQAARALLSGEPETLGAALRGLDAQYVVVSPRSAGGLNTTLSIAGVPAAERGAYFQRTERGKTYGERAFRTALWRLAMTPPDVAADHYPGLQLVYRSARRETLGGTRPGPGEASGPVLSIYRVAASDAPGDRPEPSLHPR